MKAWMRDSWVVVCQATLRMCCLFLLILPVATGCSILSPNPHQTSYDTTDLRLAGYDPSSLASMSLAKATPPSTGPSIILEVHHSGTHMERIPLPTNRPWFVQDLVQEAELLKRVGRLQMSVLRPNGENTAPLRLDVGMTPNGKQIDPAQNYALHAGDHVIVRADNRTFFDNMIPKVLRGK